MEKSCKLRNTILPQLFYIIREKKKSKEKFGGQFSALKFKFPAPRNYVRKK